MIRALQKKFVVTAMIAVSVLLLVVLGALNVFNAVFNARQTEFLLDDLGRQGAFFPRTEGRTVQPPAAGGMDSSAAFASPRAAVSRRPSNEGGAEASWTSRWTTTCACPHCTLLQIWILNAGYSVRT